MWRCERNDKTKPGKSQKTPSKVGLKERSETERNELEKGYNGKLVKGGGGGGGTGGLNANKME